MTQPLATASGTGDRALVPGGLAQILVHASLDQAEPGWRALQNTGISYGFQTFEWLSAWQDLFGGPQGVRPVIVELLDTTTQAPLMVAPLGVYEKTGLRTLSFLGGWLTDYHAPLLDPDFARSLTPECFRQLWDRIRAQMPPVDYVHFWRMPEHVEDVPNPFTFLAGARADEQTHFAVLPREYGEYAKRHSSAFRSKVRRKRDRLKRMGTLAFSVADTEESIATTMDALVRQKSRRHMETTGHDPYAASPCLRQFYERLLRTGTSDPRGFLGRLTVDGVVIAALWSFIHRKRFLSILSGYEAGEWGRCSPGVILKEEVIRWCIAEGIDTFDLTVGNEEYKGEWTETTMPVFSYRKPITPRGYAHAAAVGLRQVARRVLSPLRRKLASHAQRTKAGSA